MKKIIVILIFLICLTLIGCEMVEMTNPYFFSKYTVHHISNEPLFLASGEINQSTLNNLLKILEDTPQNTTAADFSNLAVDKHENLTESPTNIFDQSGAIYIKLFETIPDMYDIENKHLTEFTNQWWQLVYRSTDNGNDVLTLWMVEPYRLSYFGGNRYNNPIGSEAGNIRRADERFAEFPAQQWRFIPYNETNTIRTDEQIANDLSASNEYFFEGNYSTSIARENLLRDFSFVLEYFDIERFLVAPKDLPNNWQSSYFQTGTNAYGRYYSTGEFLTAFYDFEGSEHYFYGLGAAGKIWGHHANFNIINGKDGLSVGQFNNQFPHTTIQPTYNDLIWLPSDFEIRSMGHDKDIALFQTFITDHSNPSSGLRWNYENTREEDWRYGVDQSGGRSGLWQLNGFDRAFNFGITREQDNEDFWQNSLVWLRSIDTYAIGNANVVSYTGNRYGYGVVQMAGLRPAVHLDVGRLVGSID